MWFWVEHWKDGREAVFGPFGTMKEAASQAAINQMPWAEQVVERISVEKRS